MRFDAPGTLYDPDEKNPAKRDIFEGHDGGAAETRPAWSRFVTPLYDPATGTAFPFTLRQYASGSRGVELPSSPCLGTSSAYPPHGATTVRRHNVLRALITSSRSGNVFRLAAFTACLMAGFGMLPSATLDHVQSQWLDRWLPSSLETAGPFAWYDDRLLNTTLASPHDNLRWTHIHTTLLEPPSVGNLSSAVRKLEILAFIEEIPFNQKKMWQILTPPLDKYISASSCVFRDRNGSYSTTRAIWGPRWHDWEERYAAYWTCDIPKGLDPSRQASIHLSLELFDAPPFVHEIRLTESSAPVPSEAGSIAVCVAPVYGHPQLHQIIEWRLHHLQLGVQTVHWYDRSEGMALREWVAAFNENPAIKDTYTQAPPISPQTYLKDSLHENGIDGDQILYYMDCQARARHTYPTEWLALTDLDEYLMPDPFGDYGPSGSESTPIQTFLASTADDTAAICLERTHVAGPSLFAHEEARHPVSMQPQMALLSTQKVPVPGAWDNRKCLYRASAMEVPAVHWPVTSREDQPAKEIAYHSELPQSLRLLHLRAKFGSTPFEKKYPVTQPLRDHILQLWKARDDMLRRLQRSLPVMS